MYRRRQWVVSDEKKRPIDPNTGRAASPTDPTTWGAYAKACAMVDTMRAAGRIVCLGFVLTAADPYVCIDLDKCRDPETGNIEPWALEIVEAIGSYAEISPSGTGLHIWMLATMPGDRNRTGRFEVYATGRYITVTERSLPGYPNPVHPSQEPFNALYAKLFPAKPTEPRTGAPPLTMDDREILDRLQRDEKGRALLRGDTSEHGGDYSKARMALGWKCRHWNANEAQITRILRSSPLWKESHSDKERDRRSAHDARTAVETFPGPYHDPNYLHSTTARLTFGRRPTPPPSTDSEPQTIEELRAELTAARAERDALRSERDASRDAFHAVTSIVSIETLDASTRLTAIGVLLLGLEFREKGRKPTKHGHHMPASWIGRYSGQKPQTVNRQLNRLKDADLIDRQVKKERFSQPVEMIDDDGVIEMDTYERSGNKNYITLPSNVVDIVPRLMNYQKPEDAPQRGGVRVPTCETHPEAGIVKRTSYYCEACYHEAETAHQPLPPPLMISDPVRTRRADAEAEINSDIKLEPEYSTDATVDIGGIKLESEPVTGGDSPPVDSAHEPAVLWHESPAPADDTSASNPCPVCHAGMPPDRHYQCAACTEKYQRLNTEQGRLSA